MAAAIGAGLPVAEPTGSHDRRHRRRHQRGRGDLARRDRRLASRSGSAATSSTRRSSTTASASTNWRSASRRRRRSSSRPARRRRFAEELATEIRGRDLVTGLPKTVDARLRRRSARRSTSRSATSSTRSRRRSTARPPELAGDIMDRGITLAGGGALLQGLEQRLRDECQMPCQLAESPLDVRGGRLGHLARGVRGDPPRRTATRQPAPRLRVRMASTCTESKYAAAGRCSRC